jgi:hypothetical protein
MSNDMLEDADERRMFDSEVSRLYEGKPLAKIAATLGLWSKMAPQQGSYAKMLAIMANECASAARRLSLNEPLPELKPRRPYENSRPNGMMESDRDFLDNNRDAAVALLEAAIAARNAS